MADETRESVPTSPANGGEQPHGAARKSPRRKRIECLDDVRRELARAISAVRRKAIDPKIGNTMIYGLATLIRCFEAQHDEKLAQLEEAVSALEAAARAREQREQASRSPA